MSHPLANSYEDIKEQVEEWGAILLSTEYINAHTKLKFTCPDCGEGFERTYTKMSSTKRPTCRKCSMKDVVSKRTKAKPHKWFCQKCNTKVAHEKNKYCQKCWAELAIDARQVVNRMNDDNNPAWVGGSLSWWKNKVIKINPNVCNCCGYVGSALVAHHLYSRSKFPDLSLDVGNGVVICANCHSEFHNQYGNNNTKEEYLEFKEKYDDKKQ